MADGPGEHVSLTPEEVETVLRRTQVAMEFEGYWVARCICGQESGMHLGEPTDDARYYVVCPACNCEGRTGDVQWVEVKTGD